MRENSPPVTATTRRSVLRGAATAGVAGIIGAGAGIVGASSTTTVVVHAEDVDPPILAADSTFVDELQAKAANAQEPILEYVDETDGLTVKNSFWLTNAILLEVDTGTVDVEEILAQDGVADLHPNYEYEIPEANLSVAVDAESDDTTYGLEQINVPDAWETFDTRGDGARIAVLDTGVDPDHPDIDIAEDDFAEFDDDGDEVDSDPHDTADHGTHVSGTVVGAEEPDDEDVPSFGVAPEATLMHGLVLPDGGGSFAQIIGGMQWAVDNDADAINMSLGAVGYHGEMIEPVRNADQAGTIVISSSGNDGVGTSGSPGNVYDAVAIGASDEDEEIASFSSGETVDTADAWDGVAPDEWPEEYVVPDVSAPGVDVLSAIPIDVGDEDYGEASGTSMAAPHVAGLVGLMTSAAEDEAEVDQLKAALTGTSWKPSDEPDEPDTRYGHGIVDALDAIARFAADGGVQGTVTDAAGEPVEGATVALDGFPVETDEDGEYLIRATAGEYQLTAEAFGFQTAERTVTVEDEEFTGEDFELDPALGVSVVEDQPAGIESGESFDVVFDTFNLETLTVELEGDYDGEAELAVDGENESFGEPINFDDPFAGEVTVTIDTDDEGEGEIVLEHTFEGVDESTTITTGPTVVVEELIAIAVVDVENGPYGQGVVDMLSDAIEPIYVPELLDAEDVLDAVADDEYEAYVVQNLGDDDERVETFAEETTPADVGVVYLDQFGAESDAIQQLSAATGDPRSAYDAVIQVPFPPAPAQPVQYAIDEDHPIFDGVGSAGDTIELYTPDPVEIFSGFHSVFEEYRGDVAASTVATMQAGFTETEDGFAVDELTSTVLAASLGHAAVASSLDFTDAAATILANATEHVVDTPPVRHVTVPADRVDPGEEIVWTFDVDALAEVELDLAEPIGITEEDVSLSVDGEDAAFGEPIAFEEPIDGEIDVVVETFDDTGGRFALDAQFVTLDATGEESTLAVTFRPTSVYEPPLEVPTDLEVINDALEIVAEGGEVVVDDGTYEEDYEDVPHSGVHIDREGITLRAADGADPHVLYGGTAFGPSVIVAAADDVTVEGFTVNLVDGETDEIGQGVRVDEGVSGVTVRDVTGGGTSCVFFDSNVANVHVEGVTAIDTGIGIGTDLAGGPVEGATITDCTVTEPSDLIGWGGVYVQNGTEIVVTDCDIEHGENFDGGIVVDGLFGDNEGTVIENNVIVGPDDDDPLTDGDAGVLVDGADAHVVDNEIEDAYYGIWVGDLGLGDDPVVVEHNQVSNAIVGYGQFGDVATVEHNVFEAETGIELGEGESEFVNVDADAVLVRYNDLSATELPFFGYPDEPFFPDPDDVLVFDCRQNYLGEREYDETIAEGDVVYDPFLTAPPDEVEFSDPTALGTDLYLDAGETYGLGVPGPTDRTIWDVLGAEGHNEFDGDVMTWNDDVNDWQPITGQGSLSDLDTLDAIKVTPADGVRAVLDFQYDETFPPGRRDGDLGETVVQEGTNVVCAPAYGDESMFDEGTAEIASVDSEELGAPAGQLGGWDDDAAEAEKYPFNAYYVEVDEAGTIECDLDAYDPTMDEIYAAFGLDSPIHDDPGAAGDGADEAVEVEDVLEAAPTDEAAIAAISRLTQAAIDAEIDTSDQTDSIVAAFEEGTAATMDDAPSGDQELVRDGVDVALGVSVRQLFGARTIQDDDEPDAEFDSATAEVASEADD